ncbi:MAG: Asp-tRNA(Asn)/Glu-tRNA(Gln) amidotransferase subunit GatB [Planctomycetales bacterium]|nr:Asp-tRNA(Asn)/Glu-tRNA(Gln) amidotransferase subunit GatB [Planctomycetales bacterium]
MSKPHEVIIGLEIHVQLATRSKLFCGCSTQFGAEPNTQTCPVCIGMPGTLPVMNRRAYELAVRTAAALDCEIAEFTKWDRKNYYYPDLPKAYQISQYDLPFSENGGLLVHDPKQQIEPRFIRLIRVHLEEDAGKSMHDEAAGRDDSRIDLNRAGTPLMEVVTQPDIRTPLEARLFLTELKLVLTYLGVSDCNMQEGSLRVDANINLHVDEGGETVATPIVEVKNLNSFRAVERALEYEAVRQLDVYEETGQRIGDVPKQTRGWDDAAGVSRAMRHKEESSDYRYFPDPDLVPVRITAEQIAAARAAVGERPAELRARLEREFGLGGYDSDVIVNGGRELVDYFLELAERAGDGKLASNWLQQDVMRALNDRAITIGEYPVSAAALAELLAKVKGGELDRNRGRDVLADMEAHGRGVEAAMASLGIESVDDDALVALCRELIAANPAIVADVQAGKAKAAGALIGQARQKNPNVNPGEVRRICLELIEAM